MGRLVILRGLVTGTTSVVSKAIAFRSQSKRGALAVKPAPDETFILIKKLETARLHSPLPPIETGLERHRTKTLSLSGPNRGVDGRFQYSGGKRNHDT